MSFNVSCSTSLPKSPDRIAGIKKPRTMARLWSSDRSNANTATYTKYIAHLFIKMQARSVCFLQFSSRFRDR